MKKTDKKTETKEKNIEDEYLNLDKHTPMGDVVKKNDNRADIIKNNPNSKVEQMPMTNPRTDGAKIDSKPLLQISQENTQAMVQSLLATAVTNANKPSSYVPDSAVETAHILLAPSATTAVLNEIDKEIKLGNLAAIDKYRIEMYLQGYTDLLWIRNEQEKRNMELKLKYPNTFDLDNDEEIVEQIEEQLNTDGFYDVFDRASTLRRALTLATISRGSGGFERTKQVQTISQSDSTVVDKTERSPGFMERAKNWSGSFNKR